MSTFRRCRAIKLPCWTLAAAVFLYLCIFIRDCIKSYHVEYVPVLQIPDDPTRYDFMGMNLQDILFYNRVPKTGSSSMSAMLEKLQVIKSCFCQNVFPENFFLISFLHKPSH